MKNSRNSICSRLRQTSLMLMNHNTRLSTPTAFSFAISPKHLINKPFAVPAHKIYVPRITFEIEMISYTVKLQFFALMGTPNQSSNP